jgi:hypothetical protein
MNFNKEKYLKYLPSKKFAYMILGFLILGIIFLVTYFYFSSEGSFFSSKEKGKLKTENLTVNELIQKDTDEDGVFDWEESLWGTDKNNKASFDGISDLAYIQNKKKELNINEDAKGSSDEGLTETEKFAREFFASFVAMKAAGDVDTNTINNFSNALGEKIVYPSLIDSYLIKNVKTGSDDSIESQLTYYLEVKTIFEKYSSKGLGDELSEINNVLTSQGAIIKNNKLMDISNAYQDFAKKTMELSVPKSLIENHLKIVNSANNTGISVTSMAKLSTDPIVGISGLSQYQKYSDEFIKAVEDLALKLSE